jgi:hypothetical protein
MGQVCHKRGRVSRNCIYLQGSAINVVYKFYFLTLLQESRSLCIADHTLCSAC